MHRSAPALSCLTSALMLAPWAAVAQAPAPAGQAGQEAYRLGVEDVIEVIVTGVEEPAFKPSESGIVIGPDGRFMYPLAGTVAAAGNTCEAVAETIRKALLTRYQAPQVVVQVRAYNSRKVSVLGAVEKPGSFPHRPQLTLRDALAMAGGILAKGFDTPRAYQARLIHSGGETEGIALDDVLRGVGDQGNRLLRPGDTLVVEQQPNTVSVLGYVQKPGLYEMRAGLRVSDAVALAGGVVDEPGDQKHTAGDLGRVTVNRAKGAPLVVDVLEGVKGDKSKDVELLPGDTVYVPPSEREVTILGYVRTPGRYSFREGERVSDLIAQAGGEIIQVGAVEGSRGDLTQVVLTRRGGAKILALDLSQVARLSAAELDARNPTLQPGDLVFVPEERIEVSVFGHVANQGRYRLRVGDRVANALALAGGPLRPAELPAKVTAADLAHCVLYRASGETVALDLSALGREDSFQGPAAGGKSRTRIADSSNPILQHGDVLVVPEADNRILVAGYVKTPGYFEFRLGETVRTALGVAGGVLTNIGSESLVTVRHADGADEEVNLRQADPKLKPGDVVTVPYARYRVAVLGYVRSPGFFEWHEGDRVVDLIATAGGIILPTTDGHAGLIKGEYYHAYLIRRADGGEEHFELDLKSFYEKGDQTANLELRPDDVIVVPKKQRANIGTVLQDILLGGSLYNFLHGL